MAMIDFLLMTHWWCVSLILTVLFHTIVCVFMIDCHSSHCHESEYIKLCLTLSLSILY